MLDNGKRKGWRNRGKNERERKDGGRMKGENTMC